MAPLMWGWGGVEERGGSDVWLTQTLLRGAILALAQPPTQCSVSPVATSTFLMLSPWRWSRSMGSQCQVRLPRDGRNKLPATEKALFLPMKLHRVFSNRIPSGGPGGGGCQGVGGLSGFGHLYLCIVKGLTFQIIQRTLKHSLSRHGKYSLSIF